MAPQWRIRDLQELCARRVVACISQGDSYLAEQLQYLPPAALEGLWAFAAETDRLTDALVAAALNRESLLDAVELGRVPLGVTERGLRRGLARAAARDAEHPRRLAGQPSGPVRWLVQALYSRSKDGATPLQARAARCPHRRRPGWASYPTHWTRTGQQDAAEERPAPKPSSALLGRARAAAHSEEACLPHVTDGAIKSMLRSAATDQGGLEVLSIAGAEAARRFADALRDHTALKDLRFRDAPARVRRGGGARRGLRVDFGGGRRVADGRRPALRASVVRLRSVAAVRGRRLRPVRRRCVRYAPREFRPRGVSRRYARRICLSR